MRSGPDRRVRCQRWYVWLGVDVLNVGWRTNKKREERGPKVDMSDQREEKYCDANKDIGRTA